MRSRTRRLTPVLVAAGLVLATLTASTLGSHAQVPDTRVDLGPITATAARQPVNSRWLRTRVAEVVSQLDGLCYQPALARRAGLVGELQVRATLARTGRLSGVAVTRTRGGTLTPALAACVRAAFARARFDLAPLPVAPREPMMEGAYVDEPVQGPPDVRYPVRVSFHLALSAPSAPDATPEPRPDPPPRTCGPDRSGCRRTGCPSGMRCDTRVACVPSSCSCDPSTGRSICTSDCGGGMCVPDRTPQPE